jgi:hypothetical protein
MLIRTSRFHKSFTLLGRSTVTFAIILIIFYSTSFWFPYNAADLGVIVILFSLILTYCLLRGAESNLFCRLCSPLLKGKPPIIFTRWLEVEENRFKFGLYKLLFSAIDNVSLSHFGNLIFKSEALSGPIKKGDINPAGTVLKLPFSAIDLKTQQEFVALLKEKCPQATLGTSLTAIQNKPILKSTTYIHILSSFIFFLILLDIGQSTFGYLELLKRYYLSEKASLEKSSDIAQKEFQSAERLRTHPPQFSFVAPKLLHSTSTAAGLQESRSKALWGIGKKDEAIIAQAYAAKLAPKSYKINLRLARLFAGLGQIENAKKTIDALAEKHKHGLLPKLYFAKLFLKENDKPKAVLTLQCHYDYLMNGMANHNGESAYFSTPPVWPPGGEEVLHELFYRDDIEFLLRDLNISPQQKNAKRS